MSREKYDSFDENHNVKTTIIYAESTCVSKMSTRYNESINQSKTI